MTISADAPAPQEPQRVSATPRSSMIVGVLEDAMANGALPHGAVLAEEPLAKLFGTSRTPVRAAIRNLAERGLLTRTGRRGYAVPGAAPRRMSLTAAMLGLATGAPDLPPAAAERIADEFAVALARALPFGSYRINEQAAADHFGVSRTVVRELLSRFGERGLVTKDARSHSVVGPLTARDTAHYYEIRARLEPLALTRAAERLGPQAALSMLTRTETALAAGDTLDPKQLSRLEADLHVGMLAESGNPHLTRMINQSQTALMVNRVFAEAVGTGPFALSLREHAIVLEFLCRGAIDAAARALEEHLHLAAARTRQRLMAISVFPPPPLPDYLRAMPGSQPRAGERPHAAVST